MSLPFKKHLEWLCLEGQESSKIQSFYDNIQLPVPTEKDIEDARERVRSLILPLSVRRNAQRSHWKEADTPFWEKHGFGELHTWRLGKASKDWSVVGQILNHPLLRTAIDACQIAGVEEEKLVLILPQVFRAQLTAKALELYTKFFGNFSDFGRGEWRDYLDRLRNDPYVHTRIFAAITKPRDEVMHLCGLPTDKAYSDFLKNVLATSSYKFNYYMRQNTPEGDAEARRWAKVGFEAGEKFEKYGASEISDFARLVQTEFEVVTPEIPTLDPETARQLLPQSAENKPA